VEGNHSAVFDVPDKFSNMIESYIDEKSSRFFTIEVCEELP